MFRFPENTLAHLCTDMRAQLTAVLSTAHPLLPSDDQGFVSRQKFPSSRISIDTWNAAPQGSVRNLMMSTEQDPIQIRCPLSSPVLTIADATSWNRQAKCPIVPM